MTTRPNEWEPDPRFVGKNWRSMFETPPHGGQQAAPPPPEPDDAELFDGSQYRPWTTQRGGPAAMLHLRKHEPKANLWTGWLLPYSSLYALEYVGGTVSLDFGSRQFIIEGRGLEGLVHLFQQGTLQAVVEFCPDAWPKPAAGPIVTTIRKLGRPQAGA